MKKINTIKKFLCLALTMIITLTGITANAAPAYKILKGDSAFIIPHLENNCGGYYYAYSGYSTTYSEAFANITLPELERNDEVANAYISLGAYGIAGPIDAGICWSSDTNGWCPYYNDCGKFFKIFDEYTAPNNATGAIMVVSVTSKNSIRLYVQFTDKNGNYVGEDCYETISLRNNFEVINGKIKCRFFRFMSLVPNTLSGTSTNSYSNGSYMKNAKFNTVQLYNPVKNTYSNWGISTSLVEQAYIVSPKNVNISYTTKGEVASINNGGY